MRKFWLLGKSLGNRRFLFMVWGAVALTAATLIPAARADVVTAPTERGVKPGQLYSFNGIESINHFNGNLNLKIPIGSSYPLGPSLSYALNLRYNSVVWRHRWQEFCPILMQPFGAAITFEPQDCRTWGGPEPHDNAGLGWFLSLGTLVAPSGPPYELWQWRYVAPDGSKHDLKTSLHHNDGYPVDLCAAPDASFGAGGGGDALCFSGDATYIRMQLLGPTSRMLEFPDGTKHYFEHEGGGSPLWPLVRMEDSAGNYLDVDIVIESPISGSGTGIKTWTLSDSHGRTHVITFEESPDQSDPDYPIGKPYYWRVKEVDLAAFGGQRAVYSFDYHAGEWLLPGCAETADNTQPPYFLSKLASVTHNVISPSGAGDTWQYSFEYVPVDSSTTGEICSLTAGLIRSMTLPTGGRFEWDYMNYHFPNRDCQVPPLNPGGGSGGTGPTGAVINGMSFGWGVGEKRYYLDSGSTPYSLEQYRQDLIMLPAQSQCVMGGIEIWAGRKTIHYREIGNSTLARTDSYFSIWSSGVDESGAGWRNAEFGRPIVHLEAQTHNGWTYNLSQRKYECDSSHDPDFFDNLTGCELKRSVYRRLEATRATCNPASGECWGINYHDGGSLTVFHDDADRILVNELTDYDGFGHYRKHKVTGDFPFADSITSYTAYEPLGPTPAGTISFTDDGLFSSSTVAVPGPGSPWAFHTASETRTSTPAGIAVTEYCYNDADGLLDGKRSIAASGGGKQDKDVVALFARDSSGFISEERYYGGDLQAAAGATPPAICWGRGSLPGGEEYRLTSTHQYGVHAGQWFMDGSTQLLQTLNTGIDPSTGLVQWERGANGLTTYYTYDSHGRLVEINRPSGLLDDYVAYSTGGSTSMTVQSKSGSTTVGDKYYDYDGLGRLTYEERSMPSGRAYRDLIYNPAGWKLYDSDWRPVGEPPPDPSADYIKYDRYDLEGRVGRVRRPDGTSTETSYFGIGGKTEKWWYRSASGADLQASRFSRMDYQGRAVKVEEESVPGSMVKTTYSYDEAGQLASMVTSPVGLSSQSRTTSYDNRGFMLSETIPEIGTITYGSYD
jgi:YD repeat-containing protein